ncbi:MAG: VWA domain-containing protein [Fibrobacter sp.]|nr:VWA domain-containing protein [Fibrobacter sp.]
MKMKFLALLASFTFGLACTACSGDSDGAIGGSGEAHDGIEFASSTVKADDAGPAYAIDVAPSARQDSDSKPNRDRISGLLTAGEWNDLENWGFWTKLLNNNTYYDKPDYWDIFPKNLVAVKVVSPDSLALANVTVELIKGQEVEFATKTDNAGFAYCWISLFDGEANDFNAKDFSLKINGEKFQESLKLTTKSDKELKLNIIVDKESKQASPTADIAFIVDATGSMGDEIDFLISDLDNIIGRAAVASNVSLRTAAVFYRDNGDDYLTRHHNFVNDVSETQVFVSKQEADGGGDYPEAVDAALEVALQKLAWNDNARARIAFLILDAPAHYTPSVLNSLKESISTFAKMGIKIIPVAASGVDKNTEFMLRFFDLATGGTYVFLTDDSGIGESHIEASVGDHEVEPLADLMVKLITKYVN